MSKILSGKSAIITGASQGLGLEIAKKFIVSGANVAICARNETELFEAKKELEDIAQSSQKILSFPSDVCNKDENNKLFSETLKTFGNCHILVNNAGVYGPKGNFESNDWAEWLRTIEINLFGSILMCREVIPHFKKKKYGKIIQLSGGGATNPLPGISAYAVSKAAIIRFNETLAEEVRGFNIDVNSIAPGALNTRMLDEIIESGPDKVGKNFYEKSIKQKNEGGTSLAKGAALATFLASNLSDGITAKLISAVWDKWEDWPNYIDELSNSDVYTLRRIVGRDRNFNWGDK
jgi:NAD(P)-dependent dehydrogenase (short-subunit alcohol dehydrogenase family)